MSQPLLSAAFHRQVDRSRVSRKRNLREFAEQEIIIPDGPFQGRKFNVDFQPFTAVFLDLVDSNQWPTIAAVGPTQTGKTFLTFVLPIMHAVFEEQESVVVGMPNLDMAGDKWSQDIRPMMMANPRLRKDVPRTLQAARGTRAVSIKFSHGPIMRFMGGQAGRRADKSRAGFTARIVAATEIDGMSRVADCSDESDPLSQILARTKAYGNSSRHFVECTASTTEGRIWSFYKRGTETRLMVPCPQCHAWISPEREDFKGWQEAENVMDAQAKGHFECPKCQYHIADDERTDMNRAMKAVHRGQTIDESGTVEGPLPPTDTLGFRWSAFNNEFIDSAYIAKDEFNARLEDENGAEGDPQRKIHQFLWAIPFDPKPIAEAILNIDARGIAKKAHHEWARGHFPSNQFNLITLGIDVGANRCHWTLIAWNKLTARGHIIDYGIEETPVAPSIGVGVQRTLQNLTSRLFSTYDVALTLIDSRWRPLDVEAFCKTQARRKVIPAMGESASQRQRRTYIAPTKQASRKAPVQIMARGTQVHIEARRDRNTLRAVINTDFWKSWFHEVLMAGPDDAASMTLWRRRKRRDHHRYSEQVCAEIQKVEITDRGEVVHWERDGRKENHYLDSSVLACAAANLKGVKKEHEHGKAKKRKATGTTQGGQTGKDWVAQARANPGTSTWIRPGTPAATGADRK